MAKDLQPKHPGQHQDQHREMMKRGKGCKVSIADLSGKKSSGEVRLYSWDKRERTRRAMKFLGICWGLGLIAVLIPGMHFILVPSFLIAGPIGAAVVSGQKDVILGGDGTCPHCGAYLEIVAGADKWPRRDLCTKCQTELVIEKT